MSHTVKKVTYTTCDSCGHTERGYAPRGWFSWMAGCNPGELKTGKFKHNCPRCIAHGNDRIDAERP